MRPGAEFFTEPSGSAQRRYEAMRAYFVDEQSAERVADQFGYSTASVHQMATLLRSGRMRLFADPRPGPRGPVKATGPLREKVISLRARRLSVTEIARILTAEGTPVSAQTVWKICAAEGLPRLRGDDAASRGPATQLAPVRAAALPGWPAEPMDLPCDHAGLLLLAPAMTELHLHDLIAGCGYPATSRLSAWQSAGTLLLAAATRVPRAHHIDKITDDAGLAFFLGLTALPKATHLSTYSYRARRESSQKLLTGLIRRLRPLGLASGEEGFNCDFHAIRHHGDDPVLEEHYVPARSQRTRSVLTFFASDHASGEMVYANAVEHPGFGGDSILPRCSGLGGRCLPRYRRLAEPRSDHFPLLFCRTSVQLRCPAAPPGGGLCRQAPAGGELGHLLVGHPLCAAGSPGRARVTRSVIACDAGGALDLGGGSVAPVPRPARRCPPAAAPVLTCQAISEEGRGPGRSPGGCGRSPPG